MRVLLEQVEKRKIKTIDEIFILKLIAGKKIKGAIGIDLKNNVIFVINAKCVVLATGGYSRIYSVSSSRPYENFGDGVSLALESGCELMDMEMIQFHPTGMVWPPEMMGTLVTEAVRAEGGVLLNKNSRSEERRVGKECRSV